MTRSVLRSRTPLLQEFAAGDRSRNSHISGNGRTPGSMLLMTEQQKRSVDGCRLAARHTADSRESEAYQEVHMQHWKRTILHTGVSLSVVGGGALLAAGTAGTHDASRPRHGQRTTARSITPSRVWSPRWARTASPSPRTRGRPRRSTPRRPRRSPRRARRLRPPAVAVGQNVSVHAGPDQHHADGRASDRLARPGEWQGGCGEQPSITLAGPREAATKCGDVRRAPLYFERRHDGDRCHRRRVRDGLRHRDASTPTELDAMFVDIWPDRPGASGAEPARAGIVRRPRT